MILFRWLFCSFSPLSILLQSEVDIKSRKLEELSSTETIPEVDQASMKIKTQPEINIDLTDS